MKKVFLSLVICLSCLNSYACLGEAQIIAEVSMVQPSEGMCFVAINPSSVRFFAASGVCPLDQETVINQGLFVSANENGACGVHPGAEVSGVVVLTDSGKLVLE